jgi:hypothetical protein
LGGSNEIDGQRFFIEQKYLERDYDAWSTRDSSFLQVQRALNNEQAYDGTSA